MLKTYLKKSIFCLALCFAISSHAHNPPYLIISEIESGRLTFENEQIAAEYAAASKRLRIRRLEAMPWTKKIYVFIKAGFEHIIPDGLDHILFVLGLFFSSLKLRPLLIQVTAFTLAHSITLILAGLGLVKIQGSFVEPFIALSIVWIAVENTLFKKTTRWRSLVVFMFGLLHGLGFANLLSQYGLPKNNFISLLFAFNVGVELGQLFVLLVAFIVAKTLFKKSWKSGKISVPASILIGCAGLYWLFQSLV